MNAQTPQRSHPHVNQRGSGLILAVVVTGALLTVAAFLTRAAWSVHAAGAEMATAAVAEAVAKSAATAEFQIVKQLLENQVPQNILDQGCKKQADDRLTCVTAGNDTAGISGVRLPNFQTQASNSTASWPALQTAFWQVFRQVSPTGTESDRYRMPAVAGVAVSEISGTVTAGALTYTWRAYATIVPIQGEPLQYLPSIRKGKVPFEARMYGWAYATDRTGRDVRAAVTLWATNGILEMTYPEAPQYWACPTSICEYPDTVNVQLQSYAWVDNDPAVGWPW